MKFQTFSVVVGDNTCNAKCPYCVSKMTPKYNTVPEINWRNFEKACKLAKKAGVTTVLLTGKGEPTLYPSQITLYVKKINEYFPLIELQTNGMKLNKKFGKKYVDIGITYQKNYLKEWYHDGLNTIALSIVHWDSNENKLLCGYDYDIWTTVKWLHNIGYSVRLSCLLIKGYIDNVEEVYNLITMSSKHKVEQLTFRSLERTEKCNNEKVCKWIDEHKVDNKNILEYINRTEKHLLNLVHGAKVYDVGGQNVCITNALTCTLNPDDIRQLIYFPDGHLRYDWQYKGAILL